MKLPNRKPSMPRLRLAALAAVLALPPALASAAGDALTPAEIALLNAPQALPDVAEGRADAPATIVEYGSLTCSHCAAFHRDVWPKLKAEYVDTGKAKFVFREFPLDPLSTAAFMLARCAGPDKRDAVIDRLFDQQADWAFAANALYKLKVEVMAGGMSEADFDACLKDQKLLDAVTAVRDKAHEALGVSSTPTFFVAGKRLAGEQGLDKFDAILAPAAK